MNNQIAVVGHRRPEHKRMVINDNLNFGDKVNGAKLFKAAVLVKDQIWWLAKLAFWNSCGVFYRYGRIYYSGYKKFV